jgi:DNA-directed RNA polymerase subunit M/transcription elongation factor TFIIS
MSIRDEGTSIFKKYCGATNCTELENNLHEFTNQYILINSLDNSYYENIYYCKLQELKKAFVESDLGKQVKKNSEIKKNLITMQSHQLLPSVWEDLLYKKKLMKVKQENLATSDIYECPICKKRRCVVTQAQVRSADEPMTTFFKCIECGHTMSFE